jgi:hypothetical protein
MAVPPRQLEYPVESLSPQDLTTALDIGYSLENVSQTHSKVYRCQYSDADIRHSEGYIPAQ